jgi:hypothetical protein
VLALTLAGPWHSLSVDGESWTTRLNLGCWRLHTVRRG